MTDNADLFPRINAVLGGKQKRRAWHIEICPNCGHDNYKFAYSESGWCRCVVCDWTGNLYQLAQLIRLDVGDWSPPVRREEPQPEPVARWRTNPHELLRRYREHPNRYALWSRYKPVSKETIDRYDFGVGRLPYIDQDGRWKLTRDEFLTLPLYEDRQLVALRGRNMGNTGPKWMSATGSTYTLWNVQSVYPGCTVWICENYVDAAWLMQVHPEWIAVAIGGATTWKHEWGEWLAQRRPYHVVVALDNDLVGQANEVLRPKLEAEWRRTKPPKVKVPESQGARIANDLIRLNVPTTLFRWPSHAPAKAGIDWVLEQETREIAA